MSFMRLAASAFQTLRLFDDRLVLTAETIDGARNRRRSWWRLPDCFSPRSSVPPLSHHGDPRRWSRDGDSVILRTVGRGQEFVLDCDHYPEAIVWLDDLLARNKRHYS